MKLTIIKNSFSILLIAFLLVSCNENKSTEAENTNTEINSETEESNEVIFSKEQYALAAIKTGTIEEGNLSNIVKLNGKIEADPTNKAIVSAQLGGYVKSAGLIIGTPVKKGQLLAAIENVEFITIQQEYLESINELQFLTEEYNRQKQLREEDINSKKTFQKVSSQYKILQAKVKGLEQKLALIGINKKRVQEGIISRTANLYAPISGYVKTSNAIIGDYVAPTDVIFEIVNTDKIHLELHAYESNIQSLSIGQKVRFSLANETDFKRIATIKQIGKASGNDRVIIVHCDINKESAQGLLPEMYVKSHVALDTTTKQIAPTEAVVSYKGKSYLILEENKTHEAIKFRLIEIKKGITQDNYTAIEFSEEKLNNSNNIVTTNAHIIISALKNSQEEDGGH